MTKKWIKLAQVVLSLVSLLVISLHPAVSSAADDADVQAKLKSLVEANVLKPIPFKGNCTSIQFKVQVGSVFKLVDLPDTPLKVVVPYEIYWYPASDQALVNGKKVDQGVLDVKEDNETLFVKYDPRSNPNGAKGTYVLKVRLNINNEVIGKILIAKLVFNHDCGSDQPGAPDDPGTANRMTRIIPMIPETRMIRKIPETVVISPAMTIKRVVPNSLRRRKVAQDRDVIWNRNDVWTWGNPGQGWYSVRCNEKKIPFGLIFSGSGEKKKGL